MKEYTKRPENTSRTLDSNAKASRQAPISEILQAYKNDTLGRQSVQRESIEEEKTNNTGLPDNLKTGIENLSGYSLDDIRVHYNSNKPAQLSALAYTQGTDIHVGFGQEQHLPHEAWHVVQQKQGRVQPITQLQGVNINDNKELEKEADTMGQLALYAPAPNKSFKTIAVNGGVIQCKWIKYDDEDHLYYWNTLRSGVRWYYNDALDMACYLLESKEDVPIDLLEGYEENQDGWKSYQWWKEQYQLSMAEMLSDTSAPGFGMELEIKPTAGALYQTDITKGKVPEEKIKAKKIYGLAGDTVAVTFDTLSGYDPNAVNDLTVELIFDAKKIPLKSDLEALGDTLVEEIREMSFEHFEEKRKETSFKDLTKKKDDQSVRLMFPKERSISLNIHITMAMSLNDLGNLMKNPNTQTIRNILGIGSYAGNDILFTNDDFFSDDFETRLGSDGFAHHKNGKFDHTTFHKASDQSHAFIRIIQKMFEYTDTDTEESKNDPKQGMKIMNRTSFGKMFTMLASNEQDDVLKWINHQASDRKGWKLTFKSGTTIQYLLKYFSSLYKKERPQKEMIDQDPSYLANQHEKLGISHLGDKTEKDLRGIQSPIFEFRVGGNSLKLNELSKYLGNLRRSLADFYFSHLGSNSDEQQLQ